MPSQCQSDFKWRWPTLSFVIAISATFLFRKFEGTYKSQIYSIMCSSLSLHESSRGHATEWTLSLGVWIGVLNSFPCSRMKTLRVLSI
jgi:hypothetical protein